MCQLCIHEYIPGDAVSGERNEGCWLRYVELISGILSLRRSYCCVNIISTTRSITISINCWWVANVKREPRDSTSKPQVDPSSSFGAASLIKPNANFPCEWMKTKTTIKILLQHYHIVFTSPAILYRIYASSFIFVCGLKYLKVDILRAGAPSFLVREEPVRKLQSRYHHSSEIQNALVSRRSKLRSWKVVKIKICPIWCLMRITTFLTL